MRRMSAVGAGIRGRAVLRPAGWTWLYAAAIFGLLAVVVLAACLGLSTFLHQHPAVSPAAAWTLLAAVLAGAVAALGWAYTRAAPPTVEVTGGTVAFRFGPVPVRRFELGSVAYVRRAVFVPARGSLRHPRPVLEFVDVHGGALGTLWADLYERPGVDLFLGTLRVPVRLEATVAHRRVTAP